MDSNFNNEMIRLWYGERGMPARTGRSARRSVHESTGGRRGKRRRGKGLNP
jgi:hypothetical protein